MLRVRVPISGWSGGPGLHTFYFETPLQDADAALRCVGYVRHAIDTIWKGTHVNSTAFAPSGDVDVLTAATGAVTDTLSVAGGTPIVGTGAGGYAPPAVALLLRLSTANFIAGRRLVGRSFFSPLSRDTIQDDGSPTVEAMGIIRNGGLDILGALESGDSWVVWHRPKGGSGGEAFPIVAVTVPDKFAVLKSRRD